MRIRGPESTYTAYDSQIRVIDLKSSAFFETFQFPNMQLVPCCEEGSVNSRQNYTLQSRTVTVFVKELLFYV